MSLSIAFRVTNFSDADERLCVDNSSSNVFPTIPRTSVGTLCGLSITDARRCMPVQIAWAISISGSEIKVKLSSASSITFERSSRSNVQRAPRIEQNSIWKHLQTTICLKRFQKQVSRNVMLNCFQTQENISICIKIVSKRVYKRDISAVWKPSMTGTEQLLYPISFQEELINQMMDVFTTSLFEQPDLMLQGTAWSKKYQNKRFI